MRRRKPSLIEQKHQRTRLMCEMLEPRFLLAADAGIDDTNLLNALDSLTITDDGSAAVTADSTLDDAPGSLATYLSNTQLSIDAAGDDPGVDAVQPPEPRHNNVNPLDVDVSGSLTPLDALLVINHLNYGDPSLTQPDDPSAPGVFYTDVDGDGQITPADADAVIQALDNDSSAPSTPQHALALSVLAEGETAPRIASSPVGTPPPPPPAVPVIPAGDKDLPYITSAEAANLLSRAASATPSQDAIIAIVDRGGNILGVRVENGVFNNIHDAATMIFAIDGAVAKARTAAFFANDEAPLTARTIRSLSQTTITQREVESNPTIPNPNDPTQNPYNEANAISHTYGPGTVAPIGVGGHFPPDIAHTPPVDLFNIELQSRDSLVHPGADQITGTPDDIVLSNRFNVPTADLPVIGGSTYDVPTPQSYGMQSGLETQAVGRGIATLPGGIPLYKNVQDPNFPSSKITQVGGVGVFFPGNDGYATHEQGFVKGANQTSAQRLNSNKELEAEYIAAKTAGVVTIGQPLTGYTFPLTTTSRIDLVGITLEIVGPNPTAKNHLTGLQTVLKYGKSLGAGVDNGANEVVLPSQYNPASPPNPSTEADLSDPTKIDAAQQPFTVDGQPVPSGWLVEPHDSPLGGITQADVEKIVNNSIAQAVQTRAAIRLPAGTRAKFVIAVADKAGNILGLYRMPDATIFSIDVAVAKARNTAYYADPNALQNEDKVDDDLLVQRGTVTVKQLNKLGDKNNNGVIGTPDLFTGTKSNTRVANINGLAFTNRTFRFVAEPRYPSGVDGSLPPVFSILTDPGINRKNAENFSSPMPVSRLTSVMAFDAFHTSRNFHDPGDVITPAPGVNTDPLANQNGIVFFPGSSPLYKTQALVGGFGISGDGVDQDDVVTFAGEAGFAPPANLQADTVFYRGVRLPQQKFNRNPQG
jgi:uncharacterized protein GlcG (DUF336 family)